MTRHLHRVAVKFPRTMGEAFKDASYANAVERPAPRSPLARWVGISVAAAIAFVVITGRMA